MSFRNKGKETVVVEEKKEIRNDFSFEDVKLIDAEYKITGLLLNYKALLDNKVISKEEYEEKKLTLLDKLADINRRELSEGPSKIDIYREAVSAENGKDFDTALKLFDSIRGYSDVEQHIENIRIAKIEGNYLYAKSLLESGREEESMAYFREILNYKDSHEIVDAYYAKKRKEKYEEGLSLMEEGKLKEAIEAFDIVGDYEKAIELRDKCDTTIKQGIYNRGIIALEKNEFDDALEIFNSIKEFSNSQTHINVCVSFFTSHYEAGLNYQEAQDYNSAIKEFMLIPNYKDSAVRQGLCERLKEEVRIEQLYQYSILEGDKLDRATDEEVENAIKDLETIISYKKASKYIKIYKKTLQSRNGMKKAMEIKI